MAARLIAIFNIDAQRNASAVRVWATVDGRVWIAFDRKTNWAVENGGAYRLA